MLIAFVFGWLLLIVCGGCLCLVRGVGVGVCCCLLLFVCANVVDGASSLVFVVGCLVLSLILNSCTLPL